MPLLRPNTMAWVAQEAISKSNMLFAKIIKGGLKSRIAFQIKSRVALYLVYAYLPERYKKRIGSIRRYLMVRFGTDLP